MIAICVAILALTTLPWTLGIAERLDHVTTTAVVVLGVSGNVSRAVDMVVAGVRCAIGIAVAVVALLADRRSRPASPPAAFAEASRARGRNQTQ